MITWFSAMLGPIFAKEMVEMSRRVRYYFIRVLFGFGLVYGAFLVFGRHSTPSGHMPTAYMAYITGALVAAIGWVQILTVYLLVPLFLCGVVTAERDAGTLDQLFTTHLTNHEIVFGKLASRLLVMVMLVLSGIPVLNIFLLLGGIGPSTVWLLEGATLLAIIHVGGFGIYWAAVSRTPFQALWKTYACLLAAMPFAIASPIIAFSTVMSQRVSVTFAWLTMGLSYAFNFALAWWLVRKATHRIRDALPPRKLWKPRLTRRRAPALETAQSTLTQQAESVAGKMRAVWGPLQISVVDREPPLSKNLWVLVPLIFAFAFNYHYSIHFETEEMSWILLPIWAGSFTLTVIVAITNPLFSRRPGFFDLLLGTLLEPAEILRGAILVSGPWLVRIFLVPWVLGILWSSWNPAGIACVLVTGSLFACFILMLGNLCSLADHRAAFRLAGTFLFPMLVAMGPWMLPESVREWDPGVLWGTSAVAVVVAWLWVRSRLSALAMGMFLTMLYFFFTTTIVLAPGEMLDWWDADGPPSLALISPWYWMLRALDVDQAINARFVSQFLLHWLALATTLCCSWIWSVRHFDRLVGRVLQDEACHAISVDVAARSAQAV